MKLQDEVKITTGISRGIGSAIALQVNVRDLNSIRQLLARTIERSGKFDILVKRRSSKLVFDVIIFKPTSSSPTDEIRRKLSQTVIRS